MMVFWIVAVALLLAALLFILPPLFLKGAQRGEQEVQRKELNVVVFQDQLKELESDLQNGTLSEDQYQQAKEEVERELLSSIDQEQESNANGEVHAVMAKASAWFVILALPILSFFLYGQLGGGEAAMNPETAQVQADGHQGANVQQMISTLEDRLRDNPDDAEGWAMLRRSYYFIEQFRGAADAYGRAVELMGDVSADLLSDYADALALAQGRSLMGEPANLIRRALQVDPNHAKSLWLAGTAAYQGQQYAEAKEYWERLVVMLQPGSENAQMIEANLAELRQMLGEPTVAAASSTAATVSIRGSVALSDQLASMVSGDDTVFVFARAASGPRMPLAIVRKQVKDLPFEFTLDDAMAMNPAMKLSSFSEVVVGARVSKSGMAMPQSGDLEGTSDTISVNTSEMLEIVIDKVIP